MADVTETRLYRAASGLGCAVSPKGQEHVFDVLRPDGGRTICGYPMPGWTIPLPVGIGVFRSAEGRCGKCETHLEDDYGILT